VSAIFIISAFLIVVASLVVLRTKRSPSHEEAEHLPPGFNTQGLFGAAPFDDDTADDGKAPAELERDLRARAARGEIEVLRDAQASGGPKLYHSVLDTLIEQFAKSPSDLHALADFIAQSDDLRAAPALADRLLEVWRQAPTRSSTARLLRVAALSDDAGTFERVVNNVLESWQDGRLRDVSAAELRSLFEGEYWLLSSEAKRSGAGFVLKQTLADVRRKLFVQTREHPPTDESPNAGGFTQKERP
jgi:hypothetical protein